MMWAGSHWQHYRHGCLHWWQWIWRHLTWPGARFHCAHSSMPQLSRERREDGSKVWFCEDCGMLYAVKDHCYRPTNRHITMYLTTEEIEQLFDSDYVPARDNKRLTGQTLRIATCMMDGQWRSLAEIEAITGDPTASISAQLRHLRKERCGAHIVNKNYLGNGLWHYQLKKNTDTLDRSPL